MKIFLSALFFILAIVGCKTNNNNSTEIVKKPLSLKETLTKIEFQIEKINVQKFLVLQKIKVVLGRMRMAMEQ